MTEMNQDNVESDSCIFCKIVRGEIPCHKVFENDHVLAFLDIMPLAPGHMLVIPKTHYARVDQMPADLAGECLKVVPALSNALMKVTGVSDWNLLQNNGVKAGQAVHHVHFHLIPRTDGDELGYRWPAGKLAAEEAQRLVSDITAAI